MNNREKLQADWAKKAANLLVGKTVKSVSYLTGEECQGLGWSQSAIVIELSDGTYIWPSQDDEGNGPGALFTSNQTLPTFGTI